MLPSRELAGVLSKAALYAVPLLLPSRTSTVGLQMAGQLVGVHVTPPREVDMPQGAKLTLPAVFRTTSVPVKMSAQMDRTSKRLHVFLRSQICLPQTMLASSF